MRWRLALVSGLGLLLCFGCNEGKAKLGPSLRPAKVAAPTSLTPTSLHLTQNERSLRVGDSPDVVERVFSVPPTAYTFKELPPGFNSPYRSRGYETSKGDGFGVIYFEDRVSSAIFREQNVTAEDIQEAVSQYTSEFGSPTSVISGRIAYWFWQVENQRFMICQTPDVREKGRYDLTIALGVNEVMDALRMNYQYALQDRTAAQDYLPTPTYKG